MKEAKKVKVEQEVAIQTQWRCGSCNSLNNKTAIIKDGRPTISCWHCHQQICKSDGKWFTANKVKKNIKPGVLEYEIEELPGDPVQVNLHETVEIQNWRFSCPSCLQPNLLGANAQAPDRKKPLSLIKDRTGNLRAGTFARCFACGSVISQDETTGEWYEMEAR